MKRPNYYSGISKVSTGISKGNVYLVQNICNLPAIFCKGFLLNFFPGFQLSNVPLYVQKYVQILISNFFLINFVFLFRKTEIVFGFSIKKLNIPTNFMYLWSKLKSEICQKAGSSNKKMGQNWSNTHSLTFFFSLEKTLT